jgi:hypothetical protein
VNGRLKVITAVVLFAGLAGWLTFLVGQSLDRAGQWTTVVGFFVSTALGVAGVVLGLLSWRQGRQAGGLAATTGDGAGVEQAVGEVRIGRTGSVRMSDTGGVTVANTGAMGDVDLPREQR